MQVLLWALWRSQLSIRRVSLHERGAWAELVHWQPLFWVIFHDGLVRVDWICLLFAYSFDCSHLFGGRNLRHLDVRGLKLWKSNLILLHVLLWCPHSVFRRCNLRLEVALILSHFLLRFEVFELLGRCVQIVCFLHLRLHLVRLLIHLFGTWNPGSISARQLSRNSLEGCLRHFLSRHCVRQWIRSISIQTKHTCGLWPEISLCLSLLTVLEIRLRCVHVLILPRPVRLQRLFCVFERLVVLLETEVAWLHLLRGLSVKLGFWT